MARIRIGDNEEHHVGSVRVWEDATPEQIDQAMAHLFRSIADEILHPTVLPDDNLTQDAAGEVWPSDDRGHRG